VRATTGGLVRTALLQPAWRTAPPTVCALMASATARPAGRASIARTRSRPAPTTARAAASATAPIADASATRAGGGGRARRISALRAQAHLRAPSVACASVGVARAMRAGPERPATFAHAPTAARTTASVGSPSASARTAGLGRTARGRRALAACTAPAVAASARATQAGAASCVTWHCATRCARCRMGGALTASASVL